MTRRTIRRYAHELYPHPDESEVRPLSVEVPYLYARAVGLNVWGTAWFDTQGREASDRILLLLEARQKALIADALLQGLAGDEAWAWAVGRCDETGEVVHDRAVHYGVPVSLINPYPCGPELDHHDHMSTTGDATGHGIVTRIDCPESECPTCTEEIR